MAIFAKEKYWSKFSKTYWQISAEIVKTKIIAFLTKINGCDSIVYLSLNIPFAIPNNSGVYFLQLLKKEKIVLNEK